MSVTDDLYDLVSAATLDPVAARIFIAEAPENYTYQGPYIIIRSIGGDSVEDVTGGVGLATERFEFACHAKVVDGGNKTCRLIMEQIRVAIQGFAADDDHVLSGASFASRSPDLYDDLLNAHVKSVDFEVSYSEAVTAEI